MTSQGPADRPENALTTRCQQWQDMQRNQQRLVAILDSTSDIITMHGHDGAMQYMNLAGRRFFGLISEAESRSWCAEQGWCQDSLPIATGTVSGTIERFHPEWAARLIRDLAIPIAIREGLWKGETAILDKHANEVPVSLVIIVHYDDQGHVTQTSSMMRDISEQKRLEKELARNAITDHLTGAYNRQRFDEDIDKALARMQRHGIGTALILLDIDHFKPINDTHGHDVGDDVLIELTALIQRNLRVTDLLARWGGEEFVILLPDTCCRQAVHLGNRLREHIADHPFAQVGHITVSLGLTCIRAKDSRRDCIKRLDEALYRAKRAGRDQMQTAFPDE